MRQRIDHNNKIGIHRVQLENETELNAPLTARSKAQTYKYGKIIPNFVFSLVCNISD